jgi:hypoxanthine-guanine phosphoribosyltransferase
MMITKESFSENSTKTQRYSIYYDCVCSGNIKVVEKLKVNSSDDGWFNFSFENSINPILKKETGLSLKENRNGNPSLALTSDEHKIKVRDFVEKYYKRIFINSLLHICIALDFNIDLNKEEPTNIGRVRDMIKYGLKNIAEKDLKEKNIVLLTRVIQNFIQNTPFYQNKDTIIIAVPKTKEHEYCFVEDICKRLNDGLGKKDYSGKIRWDNKSQSLKEVKASDKWDVLDASRLVIDEDVSLINKNIILLDDLYQSGTTMNYMAMKLQERKCNEIYGLAIVKSCKNTDNN